MKTSTLRQLLDSLTEVRHYHVASALLEADPVRRSREHDKAYRVGAMLDAIGFELSAREAANGRTQGAAHRAERYLQRLLEDFLALGDLEGVRRTLPAVPTSAQPAPRGEIAAPRTDSATGEGASGEPACRPQRTRAGAGAD